MRSFYLSFLGVALAEETCSDGTCAQDEATLLQMQGLRAKLKKHKQTGVNKIWDQWEVDNSKCNLNVNLVCVDSQEECQGVAEANGHDWYSFRHNLATNNQCDGQHKCFSSAGCDDGLIGDRTNEWRIYSRFTCTLSAYWEYGNGGCGGNDQNNDWCGGLGAGDCPATIQTSLCPSGTAYRAVWHPKPYEGNSHAGQGTEGHYVSNGVEYIWHAQYACQEGCNLENGGFEEGFTPEETGNTHTMSGSGYEYTSIFPGWTAAGGTVMVASGNGPWGGIVASSGDNLLALQSASAEIKQTVSNLRAGQSYTLTVNAAQRTNSPGGTDAALKVSVNGQELMNEVVSSTTMEAQVMTFTADSGLAEIKIENDVASGDQTVFVDGITLTEAF